jgi:hypothetical protein
MHTPSAETVLELWERASACRPEDRALVLLASVVGDTAPGAMTVGECEDRLLALHEALFGSQLHGFAHCPSCGEALELGLTIAELRAAAASPVDAAILECEDYQVEYRILTGADLADAARCQSLSEARTLLLERAIVSATRHGRHIRRSRLPRLIVERLAQRLAECDPRAEALLHLNCPQCRHEWTVLLDASVFVWTKLRARAQRLLHDVHTLAMAYGWHEAEIVAMSSRRREAYLALVGA